MSDQVTTPGAGTSASDGEGPGTYIGRYKLLAPIGEGGFGSVFEAEQTHPVKRRVALKLIKSGMDTREVLARFEAERQALALMDHPHIARVLDAGATESGRPYFVMELVKGEPISEYCDKHSLSITQRLTLFEQVCTAVQHAHTKGVIHRDIKPSNILVSEWEDQPFAKVIDFGIAKATNSQLTDKSRLTAQYQIIGTPYYMSPEQAEGSADIDTRTDIYSLGVLLYKLITDTTPYESVSERYSGEADFKKIICEAEPPRPSACLAQSTTTLSDVAKMRGMDSRKLTRMVRGELDWIVMKAIEKERTRRYETASGLAIDVRRYLDGQPVLAAPPSATYRLKKFVRRHKGAVAAGLAVTAALLVGVVGFAWQAHIAQARANELEQVSKFQADMLAQVDPTKAGKELTDDVKAKFAAALVKAGVAEQDRSAQVAAFATQWQRVNATDAARDLIDRTILKPAVAAIDKQFKGQPVVDAALRQVLADRYENLGMYEAAMPLQERALAIRRHVLGEEHPDTLESINNMGYLLQSQGKLKEAEPYFREALEKRRRVSGEEHPDTLSSVNNMGELLQAQGKLKEAEPYYREALDKRRRVLGEEHANTLDSISNMGFLLKDQGKLREAEPYYREALEKRRRLQGEEHPNTLQAISSMGELLQAEGKLSEAESYDREALEKRRRVLGEEHPDTLDSINNMGELLQAEGRLAEAEPLLRESMDKCRRVLGEEHPDTLSSIGNMGYVLQAEGKLSEAEPYYREALEKRRRVLGEEHPNTLVSINTIGELLEDEGKLSEAEPFLRDALEKRRRLSGEEHPDTLIAISNLGHLLEAQGKLSEAEPYFREALEKRRRILGEEHPDTLTSIDLLGELLQDEGKLSEAEPLLRDAMEKSRRASGPENLGTVQSINNLGYLLQAEGKLSEAEPLLREALETSRRVRGEEQPDTLTYVYNVGNLLQAQGKHAEAVGILAPAEGAIRHTFTDANAVRLASFLKLLGEARAGQGNFAAAETNLAEANDIYFHVRGPTGKNARGYVQAMVVLYTNWSVAERDRGYKIKAAKWQRKLDAVGKPNSLPSTNQQLPTTR